VSADTLLALYEELHMKADGVCLFIQGHTLKRMSEILELPVDHTTDGKSIKDTELYMVSPLGTWEID
jgi:hypothetical protein